MTLPRSVRILAWALYDFAVTVFAMNVTSRYFGLWLTETQGGTDAMYSLAFALSAGAAALLMPALGAASDRWGRRLPFLRVTTLLCIAGTALIGWSPTASWGLFAFALANIGCQLGGLFYDALLPTVAEGRWIGRASGVGVAMGYVGAAVGLWSVQPVVRGGGYGAAFLPTAALILLAALPAMSLLRDAPRPQPPAQPPWMRVLRTSWELLVGPRRQPGLFRLFVGCFFGINAINTVIMFMAVYAKRTVGLTDPQIDALLLFSTLFALLGALGSGWLTDRWGPRRCLIAVFCVWCVAVTLGVVSQSARWLWVVGPLVGICLGGTWTSARALLVRLSPPAHLGLLFGIYGLVGRASSNVGPLLWGRITQEQLALGPWTDRIALASLLILFVIGLIAILGLPKDHPHAIAVS